MKRTALRIWVVAVLLLAACGRTDTPPAQTDTPGFVQDTTPIPSEAPEFEPEAPAPDSQGGLAPEPGQAEGSDAPPAPAQAQPARQIGELVYTEGTVTVHRSGGVREAVDIGDVIRQYDVLSTGPDSRATVDLGSGYAGGAEVKLAANTAFYFDTKALSEGERKTVLQLLAGALAIKVDKLANGSFNVATEGAVLGVRGTIFIVDTIPDCSLLVTTAQGSVAVKAADGTTVLSQADRAAELSPEGQLDPVSVEPAQAASFRAEWNQNAIAAFKPRALYYTSTYATALDKATPAFSQAVAGLKGHKAILDAWESARAQGKEPKFTDYAAEKKTLAAALFECLKGLFVLEQPYYRLLELRTLHDSGIGVGQLDDGRDSAAFFKNLDSSTAQLSAELAYVRRALDLFSWASADSPLGDYFGSKASSLGSGALFLGGDDW